MCRFCVTFVYVVGMWFLYGGYCNRHLFCWYAPALTYIVLFLGQWFIECLGRIGVALRRRKENIWKTLYLYVPSACWLWSVHPVHTQFRFELWLHLMLCWSWLTQSIRWWAWLPIRNKFTKRKLEHPLLLMQVTCTCGWIDWTKWGEGFMKGCFNFLIITILLVIVLLELMVYGSVYTLALLILVICLMIEFG